MCLLIVLTFACRLTTSVIFQIGSMYFVSGSYPHAQQFYYAVGRGQVQKDPHHTFNEETGDEEYEGDSMSLLLKKGKAKKNSSSSSSSTLVSIDKALRLSKSNLAALEESSVSSSSGAKVKDPLKRMEDDVVSPLHAAAAGSVTSPVVVKKVPIDVPDDKPYPAPPKPSRGTTNPTNTNSTAIAAGSVAAGMPIDAPPPVSILPPKDDNREDDDDDVDEEELGRTL